ncbi:hypothetical protein [Streptomyces lucensis]|uniref:hypothetical protein n=1 Tax=Streptomyces lucensis TaxID=67319 RepID=UPI001676A554|nr:hypothetical protein [Streptomyces lucensis]
MGEQLVGVEGQHRPAADGVRFEGPWDRRHVAAVDRDRIGARGHGDIGQNVQQCALADAQVGAFVGRV